MFLGLYSSYHLYRDEDILGTLHDWCMELHYHHSNGLDSCSSWGIEAIIISAAAYFVLFLTLIRLDTIVLIFSNNQGVEDNSMVSHQRFWIMVREMLDFIHLFELGPFTLCLLCVIQGLIQQYFFLNW